MELRKYLGPGLALLVAAGVAGGIYFSAAQKTREDRALVEAAREISLRGLIGSEKESFFADPRVIDALKKQGLTVQVEKVGSRQIAQRTDLKNYDFGFPAGVPAAIKLQQQTKATQTYPTFFTVMTVASWKPLLPVLEQNGIVRQVDAFYYIVDMRRLLELIAKGTRWRDLKNNGVYNTGKSVLISSTDVRKSNSGAMYLALASYVLNDNNVVQSDDDVRRVLPVASELFLKQGLQESSSAGPFEDYVSMGIGKAPLVMIYESQFLEYQARTKNRDPDMVLLYPQPTLFTKHVLVPFNDNGARLGELLATDRELQQLATEYGYRTADPQNFSGFLKARGLAAPANLVDVIDPPSYEMLEKMIVEIEQRFN